MLFAGVQLRAAAAVLTQADMAAMEVPLLRSVSFSYTGVIASPCPR